MYYYTYPTPPYFLLGAGLIASLLCGLAFQATLKELVQTWTEEGIDRPLADFVQNSQLLIPYAGIMGGTATFLAAGCQIFDFSARTCWIASIGITLLTARFLWKEFGKVLAQIEKGEFKLMEM
jgi:hypothetical protein